MNTHLKNGGGSSCIEGWGLGCEGVGLCIEGDGCTIGGGSGD